MSFVVTLFIVVATLMIDVVRCHVIVDVFRGHANGTLAMVLGITGFTYPEANSK